MFRKMLLVSLLAGSYHASAGMIDFEALADDNTAEGTLTSIAGVPGLSITAGSTRGGTDYDPYLDYNNAGLGVCKNSTTDAFPTSTTSNKCMKPAPQTGGAAGDDNLQKGEFLRLTFSEEVELTGLFARDANHNLFDGTMDIGVDGADFVQYAFISGVHAGFSLTGTVFDFTYTGLFADDDLQQLTNLDTDDEYYLSAAFSKPTKITTIPEPGSMVLLGLGLLGLGYSRSRR